MGPVAFLQNPVLEAAFGDLDALLLFVLREELLGLLRVLDDLLLDLSLLGFTGLLPEVDDELSHLFVLQAGLLLVDRVLQALGEDIEVNLHAVGLHAAADLVADAVALLLLLGLQRRRGPCRKELRTCQNQDARKQEQPRHNRLQQFFFPPLHFSLTVIIFRFGTTS